MVARTMHVTASLCGDGVETPTLERVLQGSDNHYDDYFVTPCRVTTLLRAQARLYAEALSLYTPHNGTQVHTVAYRGAVEYVVSIIAVA